MKALQCHPPSVQLIHNAPMPAPAEGESLIKTRMAGICRTDLELTQGYMGYQGILGHEFVGQIEDRTSPLQQGTRIAGEINAGCGNCSWCKQDMERHCPNRSVLGILNRDGCMAEWIRLPNKNIYPLPDTISDTHGTFIEPIAAVLEIFEQIKLIPSQSVCLIGDGKLGLLTAMVFGTKHEGETLLVGHHPTKLNKVQDFVTPVLEGDISDKMNKHFDLVIEVTGKTGGLQLAMQLAKPRATIVLKSTMAKPEALDLTPIVIDEITLVGSRCGQFAPAIAFLAKHPLPLDRLIEQVYPLEEAETAWNKANEAGTLKTLLQIQ